MSELKSHNSISRKKEPDHGKIVSSYSVPESKSKEEIWNEIESRITEITDVKKPSDIIRKLNPLVWYSVASIIILAVFLTAMFSATRTINSSFANQMHVELPDGTDVMMNAGSHISYRKKGWNENRIVKLKGEAFFNVEAGSPFRIKCQNGTVSVLGTSFNVRSEKDMLKVSCFTGSVAVSCFIGDSEYTLKHNHALNISFDDKINEKFYVFDPNLEACWRQGEFYYKNEIINSVFSELERQYDVKVTGKYPVEARYTGHFNNRDINEALEMICAPMLLDYTIKKSRVVIKEKDR